VCTGANPVVCNALDQCHVAGTCDPITGTCSNPSQADGTPCNDSSLCTSGDACQAGVCAGTAVTCNASDQCHAAGTCNPSTGVCSNPNKPNGTACDDGSLCTTGDSCQAGVCAGTAVTCNPSDQCHAAGTCDPSTGTCSNPAKPDGSACSDGNSCTQTDTCQAGACTGTNPVVCNAQDQCHVAGTCNPSTGVCSNPNKPNGTACDDGSLCTTADSCQNGTCGGTAVTCNAQDQCHQAGTCDPATGTCSNPAKPDGSTCNDGNPCTQSDTCQAGACTGSNPVVCNALDQCHVAGTCDPSTGACSNPAKPDGSACSDGNSCTQTDSCQAGACTGTNPVVCNAQDQCHVAGTCNPSTGVCSNPNKPNGTTCDDGSLCTTGDSCQNGSCSGTAVTCNPSDQCHAAGTCDPSTGTCSNPAKPDGSTCSDGNSCTQSDTCQGGTCIGSDPITCNALDQCHVAGSCDPITGTCSNPTQSDGTPCNDNSACTSGDSCQAGVCAGTAVTCNASDQCHAAGTCDPFTGTCSNPPKPNGSACSDGNACTTSDSCQNGSCGGFAVICLASDQCHIAGLCDPGSGACSNPVAPDGSACSDGNACTQSDSCQAGICTGSNPVACTALDQCHAAGTCDPASGTCSNPALPDGTTCSDGNACTQTDSCQAGTCTGANPVVCTASDQCHAAGACDPASGTCSNPVAPDGTSCNDGNLCTSSDVCTAGTCGGAPVTCDDQNACTTDSCSPGTGACVNVPIVGCQSCGNGVREGTEECDDHNLVNGDGCNSSCTAEYLFAPKSASVTFPGSLTLTNEDVVSYNPGDGTYRAYFRGGPAGLPSTAAIGGLHVLPDKRILLSFSSATTVPGVGATATTDVVAFTPATGSVAPFTSGTFALYFHGSNVGLSGGNETIDGLAVLADGRILVSTRNNFSVPGPSSTVTGSGQDIIAFTPTALGAGTAGTWALYFLGSNVGLTTNAENVDAVNVESSGKIALSTTGAFSVPGLSGQNEDIFLFTPTALGSGTAGSFQSLYVGASHGFTDDAADCYIGR
jgi:cysteine-rich repeat protein